MTMPVSPKSLESQEARARDSLFLLADLMIEENGEQHKVKVRNLSAGGMMVESDLDVTQGQSIVVNLRNIGPVRGEIAWARSGRFGVAFNRPVNPKLARKPVGTAVDETPRYLRTPLTHSPSFPR
jgi:hypothetical protein